MPSPTPLSPRLHAVGNLFVCLVAFTPWLWATLGLLVYMTLRVRDPHTTETLFQAYNPLQNIATVLLQVCALGGLVVTGVGIGQRSRRLIWQGALGLVVSALIAGLVAVAIFSLAAQFGVE